MNSILFIVDTAADLNALQDWAQDAKKNFADKTKAKGLKETPEAIYISHNRELNIKSDVLNIVSRRTFNLVPNLITHNSRLPLDARQQFVLTYPGIKFMRVAGPNYKFNPSEKASKAGKEEPKEQTKQPSILDSFTDDNLEKVVQYLKHFTDTPAKKLTMRRRLRAEKII